MQKKKKIIMKTIKYESEKYKALNSKYSLEYQKQINFCQKLFLAHCI